MTSSVRGGITSQGNIARQLQEGINAIAGEYKPTSMAYDKILTVEDSSKAYEEDISMAYTGAASVKPEGQSIVYDSMQEGFQKRYNHVVYGLGVKITKEAVDDGLYLDLMAKAGNSLARSLYNTEEQVSANLFNNGYTTALAGDGLSIFNPAHKLIKGGTQSNVLATPASLSESSLEDALIAIRGFRDHAGLWIDVTAQTLHIAPENEYVAERILASSLQPGTANNDVNAMRNMNKIPGGAHVNVRFTNPKNWFLRTDVQEGGKFFRREEKTYDQDNVISNRVYCYTGVTRFSVGVTDPLQYFGSGIVV